MTKEFKNFLNFIIELIVAILSVFLVLFAVILFIPTLGNSLKIARISIDYLNGHNL